MLLPLLLFLLPQDSLTRPSGSLQGLVFLMRSASSPARSAFFPDLRTALALADDGDTLILEQGLYTGPGNVGLVVTKDVVIRGRFGALGSVIDCEGAGRAFDFQGTQAVVEGLTIRGGQADRGGGARVSSGTVLFQDVTFEGNSAQFGGGVIGELWSVLMLSSCRFSGNEALSGGGISVHGAGVFAKCLLESNQASQFGGGLYVESDLPPHPPVHASECTFSRNSADLGGGVALFVSGTLTLDRCTLVENSASGSGGGVAMQPFVGGILFVTNSLILRNAAQGGAGGIAGGPAGISNCTVVENSTASASAGGIRAGSASSPAVVLNCVVHDNRSNASTLLEQQIQGVGFPGFTLPDLTILFSNIEGLAGSPTNIDLDPQFVDPASGDYHLLPSSPCVDAGLAFSLTNAQLDIDNEPRFQGLSVDIGCDEVPVMGGR